MGQVLHGSATTTHAVRAAIQRSKASIQELSERYGINPKTVQKWRKRGSVEDAPMGPKERRSTVLSPEEEALIVAFRKHTLLPLDDCLYALQASIQHLTRSSLHRLFQRHDISRLPVAGCRLPRATSRRSGSGTIRSATSTSTARQWFARQTTRGDIAEVRTEDGKLYMFVAIDRVTKFIFAELHELATRRTAADFLRRLIDAVPYKIHTVLTDNGIAFADAPRYRQGSTALVRGHLFDRVCRAHGITHKLTKPYHPWTNGQAAERPPERMVRTVKEATIRTFHYDTHVAPATHLSAFVTAYNFARRLKGLRWCTPFQAICAA